MIASLDDIPTELETLLRKIFDDIHPAHRRVAARTFLLLLEATRSPSEMPGELDGHLPLLWLSLLDALVEHSKCDETDVMTAEQYQTCIKTADQAARRSCKDLIDVVRGDFIDSHGSNSDLILDEINHNISDPSSVGDFIQFPHRTIHDFIAAKEASGVIAELAGLDFCPSFAFCSIMVALLRIVHPCDSDIEAFGSRFLQRLERATAGQQALIDLLKSFNAAGQRSSRRGSEVHWSLTTYRLRGWLGSVAEETCVTELVRADVIFADFVLDWACYKLFWLLFNASPHGFNEHAKQLWLDTVLLYDSELEGRDNIDDRLQCLSMLLKEGADLNKPTRIEKQSASAWQELLTNLHSGNNLGMNSAWCTQTGDPWRIIPNLIDELLFYGADPDVMLDVDLLYRFLNTSTGAGPASQPPDRSRLENVGQLGPDTSDVAAGESCLTNEDSAETSFLTVPAHAAFEVPLSTAQYSEDDLEPGLKRAVEKYFPIIKAKPAAASEASAAARKAAAASKADHFAERDDPPTWMIFDRYL